LLRWASGEV